jgi:uncharacterized protein GlcG (DUF336 family)
MTSATQPKSLSAPSVTSGAAAALIEAVHASAAGIGFDVAVAVVDNGGHLKAFERNDSVPFLAAEVALDKAWTAASYRIPTHHWNAYVGNPQVAPLAHHPRLMAVGGGYPLIENGKVIGALGISGGTYDQDQQAAETALSSLGFDIPA